MTKRQLSSKYKDLVDYVNKYKYSKRLADVLSEAIKEGESAFGNCNELWVILNALYVMRLNDSDFSDLTKTIVDIYNDNYELEEPRCYWKFKGLKGFGKCNLYFGIATGDEPLLVNIYNGAAEECTISKLNEYLLSTQLNADNFEQVEKLEDTY
jgi:hypothetical protein